MSQLPPAGAKTAQADVEGLTRRGTVDEELNRPEFSASEAHAIDSANCTRATETGAVPRRTTTVRATRKTNDNDNVDEMFRDEPAPRESNATSVVWNFLNGLDPPRDNSQSTFRRGEEDVNQNIIDEIAEAVIQKLRISNANTGRPRSVHFGTVYHEREEEDRDEGAMNGTPFLPRAFSMSNMNGPYRTNSDTFTTNGPRRWADESHVHDNANFPPLNRNSQFSDREGFTPRAKLVPVYKWNVKYSGDDQPKNASYMDVNSFILHVTMLKETQCVSDIEMLGNVHFLLSGRARIWYMTYRNNFRTWNDFTSGLRSHFLSRFHEEETLASLMTCQQRPNESAIDYVTELLWRLRGLPQPISDEKQVYILQRGLLPSILSRIGPWQPRNAEALVHTLKLMEVKRSGFTGTEIS